MGTFGRTITFPFIYELQGNEVVAERFQLTQNANVTKLVALGETWGDPYKLRGAIYGEVAGEPNSQLGVSPDISNTLGWRYNDMTFGAPIALTPAWYWFILHAKEGFDVCGAEHIFLGESGYREARLRRLRFVDFDSGLPDPMPAMKVHNYAHVIYAEF